MICLEIPFHLFVEIEQLEIVSLVWRDHRRQNRLIGVALVGGHILLVQLFVGLLCPIVVLRFLLIFLIRFLHLLRIPRTYGPIFVELASAIFRCLRSALFNDFVQLGFSRIL